jgi:hypothetical protein
MVLTAPAYLLLSLAGRDIRGPLGGDVDMVLSSWGRVDPARPRDGRVITGDVGLAYVQGSLLDGRLVLRAGRHVSAGGAARVTALDGVSGVASLWRGLGASAYAGMPVQPHFVLAPYDAVAGARLFYRWKLEAEVGTSVAHYTSQGRLFRQDAGVDGRWVLHRTFTVGGFFLLSTATGTGAVLAQSGPPRQVLLGERHLSTKLASTTWNAAWPPLAEADLHATWRPARPLTVALQYRRQSPDLYLSRASIFSVFGNERRDEVGGWSILRAGRRVSLTGDYYLLAGDAGPGQRGGMRGSLHFDFIRRTTLSTEVRFLSLQRNGYVQARAFGTQELLPGVSATLDTDLYVFRKAINGQHVSYTTAATVGYEFLPGWQVLWSGGAGVTPWAHFQLESMLRVSHSFSLHLGDHRS